MLIQICRNVGTSVACTALAVLAAVGTAGADTQKGQLTPGGHVSDAARRDKSLNSAIRNMLAVESEDRFVGSGFVPRDAAECGLTTGSPNCQDWTRTLGTAGRSADLVGIAALNGDDFKCADSFTITAAQTLTNICFDGFYVSTTNVAGTNGAPTAGNEAFRIRVYRNSGGTEPGHPDSAQVLKEWTVGANAGYGLTVDPNTTLTRGPVQATRPGVFAWQVALAGTSQLALTPGCYWLEISGATNGIPEGARLRWAVVNTGSPANDGVCYQALESGTYDYTALIGGTVTATDMAFCLNFSLNTNACSIPPAPTNNSCATAQVVTAPFTATNVSTLRSLTPVAPFCIGNPVNGNTLWYKVAGNGQTFTVDTCGTNTNFDTVINVYCGACAALNCIANNDTGPATCVGNGAADPSSVSFATVTGTDYYIAVFGFEIDAGFLDVAVSSAAGTPAGACVTDRCPVDLTGVTTLEADACGVSTNSAANCNGGTGGSFVLGTAFGGTSYNLGTNRDFDFWEYDSTAGGPLPDNSGGTGTCFLRVTYQVEFPGIFNFFNGACAASNGTFIGGAFANYRDGGPACPRAATAVVLGTPAAGPFRINLLPVDFGGVPCATGNNNYKITVTLDTVGACCQPFTACSVSPQANCLAVAGSVWTAGSACTPTDVCSGVCCTGTTCVVSAATDCTAGGTTYIGGGTCTPNSCAPAGVCCRGATCNTTITSAAACTGSGLAGAVFATGSATCNSGAVSSSPCCYANYNKVNGVSVQDIFDFLSDWFAGNAFANTGGTGAAGPLSVQNIFDFLTNWFNGGCS